MTISVSLDKTAFDSTSDPVASAGMGTFAASVESEFNDVLNGVQAFDKQKFTSAASYGITNGVLSQNGLAATPQQALITVSAETGTNDTLDTIGVSNRRFIILKAAALHTITLSSGVGNITTADGNSFIMTGNIMAMLWCQDNQWSLIGPGRGLVNRLSINRDPGSADHSGAGYSEGSLWANTTKDQAFMLLDASAGAGIWKRITTPKNSWSIRASSNGTFGVGVNNPTTANSPAAANDANNTFMTLPTTAVSGNLGGWITTAFSLVRPAHDPVVECIVKTDATITTQRLWVGLISAAITNVDTIAAGTLFIGFRWSTVAGDVGWIPVLNDGTSQTNGTAIGTVAASTVYKLKFRVVSTNSLVYFSVNDSAEQSLSTNFPAAATEMGALCRCITTSAAIRLLNFSRFAVEVG